MRTQIEQEMCQFYLPNERVLYASVVRRNVHVLGRVIGTHLCLCFLCSAGTIDFISPLNSDSICSETSYINPGSYSIWLWGKQTTKRNIQRSNYELILYNKDFVINWHRWHIVYEHLSASHNTRPLWQISSHVVIKAFSWRIESANFRN